MYCTKPETKKEKKMKKLKDRLPKTVIVCQGAIWDCNPNSSSNGAVASSFRLSMNMTKNEQVNVTAMRIEFITQTERVDVPIGPALRQWLLNYETNPNAVMPIEIELKQGVISDYPIYYEISRELVPPPREQLIRVAMF